MIKFALKDRFYCRNAKVKAFKFFSPIAENIPKPLDYFCSEVYNNNVYLIILHFPSADRDGDIKNEFVGESDLS